MLVLSSLFFFFSLFMAGYRYRFVQQSVFVSMQILCYPVYFSICKYY